MHNEVRQFIRQVRAAMPIYFFASTVLEVGSRIINGSPRKYFWFCDYHGIDIAPGKGVDEVVSPGDLISGTYEVVISTEMLEHDEHWQSSLRNMYDSVQPNGMLLITCAGPARMEHGTKRTDPDCSPETTDYYRNISIEEFSSVLPEYLFCSYRLTYARFMEDLQFVGVKRSGEMNNREIYHKLKDL